MKGEAGEEAEGRGATAETAYRLVKAGGNLEAIVASLEESIGRYWVRDQGKAVGCGPNPQRLGFDVAPSQATLRYAMPTTPKLSELLHEARKLRSRQTGPEREFSIPRVLLSPRKLQHTHDQLYPFQR